MCEIINFEQAKRVLIKAKVIKALKRKKSALAVAREKAHTEWKKELEKEIDEILKDYGELEDFNRFILRPENYKELLGWDKISLKDEER